MRQALLACMLLVTYFLISIPTVYADGWADPIIGLKLETGYQSTPTSAYTRAEISYLFTQSVLAHTSVQQRFSTQDRPRIGLGLRYQLDIFHYIPWIGSTILHQAFAQNSSTTFGLEVGLDRKLSEVQAISIALRFPTLLQGEVDWAIGVSFRYDWRLFDPFDQ